MLTIVLENCESFDIPKKYLIKRKILKGKPKSIWIDKSYLDVCDQYIGLTWEGRSKEDIQNRLKHTLDITQIYIGNKQFFTNYIDDFYDCLGADNITQTIEETPTLIKIEWDINPKNKYTGNYFYPVLTLSKKYKGIELKNYKKIKYYR